MMENVEACLDAFKHLPYFKPLYTTILRQQMQYLTDQLSQHAGEETLILTTNISAGTISSLTSTFGTGFLDHRPELKKQFTTHCAKNKQTYDSLKYDNIRISHSDNFSMQEQPNMPVKRKRLELETNHHTVKIPNIDDNFKAKDTDKSFQVSKVNKQNLKGNSSIKTQPDVQSRIGNLTGIEVDNVRSFHSAEESLAMKGDGMSCKLPEETLINEEGPDQIKTMILKEESDNADSLDRGMATTNDLHDQESNILYGSDTQILQDDKGTFRRTTDGQISMETSKNVTDDMISVRESYISDMEPVSVPEKIVMETNDIITVKKSYVSSSDEGSLPGKLAMETDGGEMWMVPGENSEANMLEMSGTAENDSNKFTEQTSELFSETGIDKAFEAAIKENFPSATSSGVSPKIDVDEEYEKGMKFLNTLTSLSRRSTDAQHKSLKCTYCPQSFTSHSSKRRHERRHTGETPWACEFCDKRFYRKDDLHVHSLKHVGQKPYMCPICKTGYCKKKLLDLHVATHTSEKPPATSTNE